MTKGTCTKADYKTKVVTLSKLAAKYKAELATLKEHKATEASECKFGCKLPMLPSFTTAKV
jgi:hypothetical protein